MKIFSTLVKALCLTIALGAPTAAFANVSTPSTTPPLEAPVQAPEATECATPDVVVGTIIRAIPDADIREVAKDGSYIIFTSPSMPTDYKIGFDENLCAVGGVEVPKVVGS